LTFLNSGFFFRYLEMTGKRVNLGNLAPVGHAAKITVVADDSRPAEPVIVLSNGATRPPTFRVWFLTHHVSTSITPGMRQDSNAC